ncbi:DUF3987 domain-containing protein [Wenyingzhuangia aestuarii]|uniref:DUF3987 domain-containing protein n=1 Tax=Wenyingzhuangia aestuarii TaxID=1647582 RepID=UPI00143AC378|nr:DUF3987 domain-containing protein [Wenyingzhuangia aestuarii]NJB84125.1 hypothetical protein [Wenyingzhuangia aestuarii]
MSLNKKSPITSESNKGDLCNSQNKDTEKKGIIDLQDLEFDSIKLTNEEDNVFPVDVFPKAIQEIIFKVSDIYQFSIDYLGSGILSAASTAIGKSYKANVKKGWEEKCNLFMVIVGRPGDSKSHALSFCYKPIQNHDKKLFVDYENEISVYEEATENKPKRPILNKLLISDFTPEALLLSHYHNKRGLTIYADELLSWLKNFNRYSSSGEAETYLSLWSGTTVSIDRATSKSIRIDDTFIGVVGSTQIGVLKEFSKEGRNVNGFIDRLLFVYPSNPLRIKWNNTKIDPRLFSNYNAILDKLINKSEEPKLIPFNKDAQEFLFAWQNNRPEDYLFDYERGIDIKLQQYVIRFAIIIQLLHHASDGESDSIISLKNTKKAILLFDYFLKTALRVREETTQRNYLESLTKLQLDILNDLPKEFGTGQGVKIACKKENGKPRISERQFKTYLNDRKLFTKLERGKYLKKL